VASSEFIFLVVGVLMPSLLTPCVRASRSNLMLVLNVLLHPLTLRMLEDEDGIFRGENNDEVNHS
jgi:hypothetical protein